MGMPVPFEIKFSQASEEVMVFSGDISKPEAYKGRQMARVIFDLNSVKWNSRGQR